MLDRGDDALPAIDGRWCMKREVKVAAAFISISPSTSMLLEWRFCLPLSTEARLFFRLFGETDALVLFECLPLGCGWLPSCIDDDFATRGFGVVGRNGAGIGGSVGLWIVLACLAGGGARMDE